MYVKYTGESQNPFTVAYINSINEIPVAVNFLTGLKKYLAKKKRHKAQRKSTY